MTIPGILEQDVTVITVIPIKFVVVHRTVSQKTPVGGNYVEVTKKERIRTDLTANSVKERIFEQWKYYDMKNWSESYKEKTTMTRYDLKHH